MKIRFGTSASENDFKCRTEDYASPRKVLNAVRKTWYIFKKKSNINNPSINYFIIKKKFILNRIKRYFFVFIGGEASWKVKLKNKPLPHLPEETAIFLWVKG